jgi:hypothetical protein
MRRLILCALTVGLARQAAAQGEPPRQQDRPSPYVSLDDPQLPLLEHLIARGDVADPSPFIRPFRRSDALRVLATADSAHAGGTAVPALIAYFSDPEDRQWWRADGQIGGEGYTHARRDPLHPAGDGNVSAYAELRLEAAVGPIQLVSRLVDQPRIQRDPDWTGVQHGVPSVLCCGWRYPDAYASAQFGWGTLFYGQMARNWGPTGVAGIGVSNVGYERPDVAFEVHTGDFRLLSVASQLEDQQDSTGSLVHRYFFAHRLGLQLGKRLHVAGWETTVIAGHERDFDARYRNPLTLGVLANLYSFGDRGNILVGMEARWQATDAFALETQIALDDLANRSSAEGHPSRYAFTIGGHGRLARSAAWRAFYTQASSLAFRTFNPQENFTDAGVGLGRNFDDNDQTTVLVTIPFRNRWLLSPELTLLRQGEGRINDPYPGTRAERLATPALFIGTVERVWRAALSVSGTQGPFRVTASGGMNHMVNADNVPGTTSDRFEGQVLITIGATRSGSLH